MFRNGFARLRSSISGLVISQPLLVRSIHAENLLEDFFVSAVVAVLAIRLYLHVTGYIQLAIGPLHIAHMVWGGFLMLAALVMLLSFLDHRTRATAAVVGGIGFGAFIDELGKFITSDNDYFFQPAVALIYVVFVLIFFAIRAIGRRQPFSSQECLANSFDIVMQASLTGLDREQQEKALGLLGECQVGPVRDSLENILRSMSVTPSPRFRLLSRLHLLMDALYERAANTWWFGAAVTGFFTFTAVSSLSTVVAVVEWSRGLALWVVAGAVTLAALLWSRRVKTRHLAILVSAGIIIVSTLMSWAVLGNLKQTPLSIIDWAQFVFPGVSGVIIVIGVLTLPRSRLHAYLLFRLSILVSIFFTQVLSFYEYQLLALVGLFLDILILLALRYMIAHEHEKREIARAAQQPKRRTAQA